MVTGCGCHDWRVFGHQAGCADGLARPLNLFEKRQADRMVRDADYPVTLLKARDESRRAIHSVRYPHANSLRRLGYEWRRPPSG